jgi:hypothetical protein
MGQESRHAKNMKSALESDLIEQIRQNHHELGNHLTAVLTSLELIQIYQSKGMEINSEDFLTLNEGAKGILESLRAAKRSFYALVGEPN